MTEVKNPKLRAFLAGATFALIAAGAVTGVIAVNKQTAGIIAENRAKQEQLMLNGMLPVSSKKASGKLSFRCKLLSDVRIGRNMPFYIVKDEKGQNIGRIATYSTGRGYSNPLIFMAGVSNEGKIENIDIVLSRETPGIGDKIEPRKGNYTDQFKGLGLNDAVWEVKKFNGDFDYITGATVTSRALVLATKDLLTVLNENMITDLLPDCK